MEICSDSKGPNINIFKKIKISQSDNKFDNKMSELGNVRVL